MIQLLTGDNTFAIDRALLKLRNDFDGEVQMYDGNELTPEQLPDVLMSQTLFASDRLVILKEPAANKALWAVLPAWLEKLGSSTKLAIVEPHADKRTSTYKWLHKHTEVHSFSAWTERDAGLAEEWARQQAKTLGFTLTHAAATALVSRVGTDQWHLVAALEKLALADDASVTTIEQIIDARPHENVFRLLDTVLSGDYTATAKLLADLRMTEDPYRVMGLLVSQVLLLVLLVTSKGSQADVVRDAGAAPFVLNKLRPHATRMNVTEARALLQALALADRRMKSSDTDPWLLIEQALHTKTAS